MLISKFEKYVLPYYNKRDDNERSLWAAMNVRLITEDFINKITTG
jgi:hypothetical protein